MERDNISTHLPLPTVPEEIISHGSICTHCAVQRKPSHGAKSVRTVQIIVDRVNPEWDQTMSHTITVDSLEVSASACRTKALGNCHIRIGRYGRHDYLV